jgi:hypothetical protein
MKLGETELLEKSVNLSPRGWRSRWRVGEKSGTLVNHELPPPFRAGCPSLGKPNDLCNRAQANICEPVGRGKEVSWSNAPPHLERPTQSCHAWNKLAEA